MGIFGLFSSKKYGYSEDELEQIVYNADQGNKTAAAMVGEMFRRGMSSEEHNAVRRKAYGPRTEMGDPDAQYWMGLLSSKSPADSFKWYSLAAEQGHVASMKSLALGYCSATNEEGSTMLGFGYDPKKEVYWLTKAAEAGDADAMCTLALNYTIGEGVEKDLEECRKWYARAADLGYPKAYLGMAELHKMSPYYDREKAICYLKKAAEKSDVDTVVSAAQSLGMMYGGCYVFGGEPYSGADPHEALYWLCQAYIVGDNPYYKEYIQKLCNATGLAIPDEQWKQWVVEARSRVI